MEEKTCEVFARLPKAVGYPIYRPRGLPGGRELAVHCEEMSSYPLDGMA